jgi:tetrahydromethanopterin S-methyltransferase subunit G
MISTHSNYRREDFYFQRQQSLRTREAKWEERLPKLGHKRDRAIAGLLFGVIVGAFVFYLAVM